MKSYKITSFGDEYLLLQCNKGEYSTTVIDKGRDYETLCDGSIIGIEKEEDSYTYYLANEEAQTLSKIADNICKIRSFSDKNLGTVVIYQSENRFAITKLDNLKEIDLGSWFERGFFLSGKENELKAGFFLNCIYTEREYVSAGFWGIVGRKCHDYAAVFLRKDGLYDIFNAHSSSVDIDDDLNIEEIKNEYLRLLIDEDDLDMCSIFYYDKENQGYHLLFEGENRINFDNAVLEVIEPAEGDEKTEEQKEGKAKTIALLYLFEGTEKVLLARTEDFESITADDFAVTVADKKWVANEDNSYLLECEFQIVEEESEDNQEDSSSSDDNSSSDGGPKDNAEYHAEPEKKKSSFWTRLGSKIGWP